MDRKSKGLCFCYGERFHPLHQCPERALKLIKMGDDNEGEQGEVLALEVEQGTEGEGLECKLMGLLGAVGPEMTTLKTMKLEGKLQGVPILLMVDSGTSHNFVAPQVTTTLSIAIDSSKRFGVRVGDGHRVFTKAKYPGLPLQLGANEVVMDAYVLDLGGVDMILGVVWLETLGKIELDWGAMSMTFKTRGDKVTLQRLKFTHSKGNMGDNSEISAGFLLEMMDKPLKLVDEVLWNMEGDLDVKETEEMTLKQKQDLEYLLTSFPEVFKELYGLPPLREFAHSIVLKEGTEPVNVRPYRYLHHQKNEIE